MENFLFCFVILHYNLYEMTKQCVNSILCLYKYTNFKIVIVDNHSPDNSGGKLFDEYKNNVDVTVLLNNFNMGFAKGNNVGIQFAKNDLKADFVCCLNNDTILIDKEFIKKSIFEFLESNVAVIAPQVILKDGKIQRTDRHLKSLEEYKMQLTNINNEVVVEKNFFRSAIRKIKFIYYLYKKYIYWKFEKKTYNVVLHGCCLIFTPAFFKKLDGFNSQTFMFREEELLYISLKKNGLESVYLPMIQIKHLEDQSTNSIFDNTEEKRKFLISNQVDSLKILIRELENKRI